MSKAIQVEFVGGPLDGKVMVVDGIKNRLQFPEAPSLREGSPLMAPLTDKPIPLRTHIYEFEADNRYVYRGMSTYP